MSDLNKKVNIQLIYQQLGRKQLDSAFKSLDRLQERQNLQQQKAVVMADKVAHKQEVLGRKQSFYGEQMQNLGVTGRQVDNILSHYGFTFDKNGQLIDKAGNSVQNINQLMKQGKIATNGFNMSLLSTMFFGMALQRTFNGLIKTSLEWVGVNELLTTTLGVVFLPIAEELLNILLPIMTWFMDLPESVQKTIGAFALLGASVGTLMMVLGTWGLGMQGLGQTFGIDMSKGIINGLQTKLGSENISKFLRIGAVAISAYMVIQDLKEGEVTAAIGSAMIGAGFYFKNQWVLAAGIALKVLGDNELYASIVKIMMKIVDIALWAAETIKKAFSLKFNEIDFGPITKLGSVTQEALAEVFEAGAFSETLNKVLEPTAVTEYTTKIQDLNNQIGSMPEEERLKAIDDLNKKFTETKKIVDGATTSLSDYRVMLSQIKDLTTKDVLSNTKGVSLNDYLNNNTSYGYKKVSDAIISPNGNIISTNPKDFLIATKTPGDLGSNGSNITISPTYNINVSDRRELEQMIERNNRQLLIETRRIVKL